MLTSQALCFLAFEQPRASFLWASKSWNISEWHFDRSSQTSHSRWFHDCSGPFGSLAGRTICPCQTSYSGKRHMACHRPPCHRTHPRLLQSLKFQAKHSVHNEHLQSSLEAGAREVLTQACCEWLGNTCWTWTGHKRLTSLCKEAWPARVMGLAARNYLSTKTSWSEEAGNSPTSASGRVLCGTSWKAPASAQQQLRQPALGGAAAKNHLKLLWVCQSSVTMSKHNLQWAVLLKQPMQINEASSSSGHLRSQQNSVHGCNRKETWIRSVKISTWPQLLGEI